MGTLHVGFVQNAQQATAVTSNNFKLNANSPFTNTVTLSYHQGSLFKW